MLALVCCFGSITADLDIDNYEKCISDFDDSTNLIRGKVLLSKGSLEAQRRYGNSIFKRISSPDICSRDDKSNDPTTQLIITLFPSTANSQLAAQGTGSLKETMKISDDELINVIVDMFATANTVRNQVRENYDADHNGNLRKGIFYFTLENAEESFKSAKSIIDKLPHGEAENDKALVKCLKRFYNTNYPSESTGKIFNALHNEIKHEALQLLEKLEKNSSNEALNSLKDKVKELYDILAMPLTDEFFRAHGFEKKKGNSSYLDIFKDNVKKAVLLSCVANSVLQERLPGEEDTEDADVKWKKRPYWPEFTNDIICAYACSVLDSEGVRKLGEKLVRRGLLKTRLTKNNSLLNESKKHDTETCFPFDPDHQPAIYSKVQKNKFSNYTETAGQRSEFSDCVETTLRHFFSILLFSSQENEFNALNLYNSYRSAHERNNGNSVSENVGEKKTLWSFFSKNEQGLVSGFDNITDITKLAMSSSDDIHCKWAEICSNYEGIDYGTGNSEIKADWRNIIKAICSIAKDYPDILDSYLKTQNDSLDAYKADGTTFNDIPRDRAIKAALRIQSILSGEGISCNNLVEIINDLLGMRADVKLIAADLGLSTKNQKLIGEIKISRAGGGDNTPIFKVEDGHAQLNKIEKSEGDVPEKWTEFTELPPVMQLSKYREKDVVSRVEPKVEKTEKKVSGDDDENRAEPRELDAIPDFDQLSALHGYSDDSEDSDSTESTAGNTVAAYPLLDFYSKVKKALAVKTDSQDSADEEKMEGMRSAIVSILCSEVGQDFGAGLSRLVRKKYPRSHGDGGYIFDISGVVRRLNEALNNGNLDGASPGDLVNLIEKNFSSLLEKVFEVRYEQKELLWESVLDELLDIREFYENLRKKGYSGPIPFTPNILKILNKSLNHVESSLNEDWSFKPSHFRC